MCGRYITAQAAAFEKAIRLGKISWQFDPSYNVAPTPRRTTTINSFCRYNRIGIELPTKAELDLLLVRRCAPSDLGDATEYSRPFPDRVSGHSV
jgi:hypothetical protein